MERKRRATNLPSVVLSYNLQGFFKRSRFADEKEFGDPSKYRIDGCSGFRVNGDRCFRITCEGRMGDHVIKLIFDVMALSQSMSITAQR